MEKDVIEKLSDMGFELDSYSNGKHECLCPNCSAKRKPQHQKQKCAAVWIEDDFVTYNCVHCGYHGFISADKPSTHKTKYTPPVVIAKDNADELEEYFKGRGISVNTLKKFGVYIEKDKFTVPMIAFPFYKGGRIVNVKYRGISQKRFSQEVNCEPIVYNYDNVFGSKSVIVVEGEIDALTFAEAGFDNVVSIPSGSIGNEVSSDYSGSKFDFLKVSQPLFDVAEKIYLALDSDLPGQFMTKALVDRLGREKIMLVDWSKYKIQGKDANDFWLKDKTIVTDAIATAKEIPLRGIIQAGNNTDMFEQYLIDGTKNAISTGFDNMDSLIKFEPGNFVTITGYPGSGKSYFATAMIMNLAQKYGMKTLYCAFENSQNQLLKKWCQMLAGRPVVDASEEVLNSIRPHYPFIREHFYIMEDMTTNLTVDDLLDVASQAIKQHGIRCMIIDPLNKLTYSKSNNMTEDIGQLLNKLIAFGRKHNILMFLVAHPTKPADGSRKLGSQSTPSGFDIAGSANFLNMSDVIITVHRKQDENGVKSSTARVMVSKVRDTDYGHEGSCYFDYNSYSGKYFEVDKAYYEGSTTGKEDIF